jgi:hypothetical protein
VFFTKPSNFGIDAHMEALAGVALTRRDRVVILRAQTFGLLSCCDSRHYASPSFLFSFLSLLVDAHGAGRQDNAEANNYRFKQTACSLGLSAISQQYFSLRKNQPPATSRNQPAVLFSQNKPAPAISHQPTEQAEKPTDQHAALGWNSRLSSELVCGYCQQPLSSGRSYRCSKKKQKKKNERKKEKKEPYTFCCIRTVSRIRIRYEFECHYLPYFNSNSYTNTNVNTISLIYSIES